MDKVKAAFLEYVSFVCSVLSRLYVRNFWSKEKRLPTATLNRMLTVLQSLYSSKIEKGFLSLATNLLLELTSQSPDFKRSMFEYPLSECTFQVSDSLLHEVDFCLLENECYFKTAYFFLSRTIRLIQTGAPGAQWLLQCLWKPWTLRDRRV